MQSSSSMTLPGNVLAAMKRQVALRGFEGGKRGDSYALFSGGIHRSGGPSLKDLPEPFDENEGLKLVDIQSELPMVVEGHVPPDALPSP